MHSPCREHRDRIEPVALGFAARVVIDERCGDIV
jgi:hypothetical protein